MFIVIDGVDASGKTTQLTLLKNFLKTNNYSYEVFDFPQYDLLSSFFVREYLSGKFSDITSKQASLLYALDRFYSKDKILTACKNKDFVLSNRYTTSNIIHQATKAQSQKDMEDIINFIEEIEYNILGLPKPDKVIFLDMHIDIAWNLLLKRGGGKGQDIHENNYEYLKNSYEKSLSLAKKFGRKIVKCYYNNQPLSVEQIHKKILNIIFPNGIKN